MAYRTQDVPVDGGTLRVGQWDSNDCEYSGATVTRCTGSPSPTLAWTSLAKALPHVRLIGFLLGANPAVAGWEETLRPVGGRLYVQSCLVITKPGTVWRYQREPRQPRRGSARRLGSFWPCL
jgi:hypothetical protein